MRKPDQSALINLETIPIAKVPHEGDEAELIPPLSDRFDLALHDKNPRLKKAARASRLRQA